MKNRKIKDLLSILKDILLVIMVFLTVIVTFHHKIRPIFFPEPSTIVIKAVPLLEEDTSRIPLKFQSQDSRLGSQLVHQTEIPVLLKIVNPTNENVVITLIEVVSEIDSFVRTSASSAALREIKKTESRETKLWEIELKNEQKSLVKRCIMLEDFPDAPSQEKIFPLLIKSGDEKKAKIHIIVNRKPSFSLAVGASGTHCDVFIPPVRRIELQVIFSEGESIVLCLNQEDLPSSCRGLEIRDFDLKKQIHLSEKRKNEIFFEILNMLEINSDTTPQILTHVMLAADEHGYPVLVRMHTIRFKKDGKWRKVTLSNYEISRLIENHLDEEYLKNKIQHESNEK